MINKELWLDNNGRHINAHGGGIMEQPLIIEKIRQRLPELLMPGFRSVQVLPAQLGNNAQLYGVLAVAEKNLH